jgi:hypothetical protein
MAGAGGGSGMGGGGRGGAGRAAAAPATPAPATVARAATPPAEPTAADIEKARAAIDTLLRANTKAPILLHLRASSERDLALLAAELDVFERERVNLSNLGQVAPAPLDHVANTDDPRNGVRQQTFVVQNGQMVDNGTNGGNFNNNFSNRLQNSGNAVGNNGAYDYNRNTRQNSGNGFTGTLTLNNYANTNRLSDQNFDINNALNLQQRAVQNAPQAEPSRATLRPDQLRQLATDFRVAVVARGDEAHVFRSIGDRGVLTEDVRSRRELLNRMGLADQVSSKAGGNASGPATAAATAVEPAAQAPAALAKATDDNVPVDCIIIMEPPPPAFQNRP